MRIDVPWVRDALLVACWWLLRGAELRALKRADVSFSDDRQEATVRLPVSKTDQEGKGAERTLRCTCAIARGASKWRALCPTHACWRLWRRARATGAEWLTCQDDGSRLSERGLARAVETHLGPIARQGALQQWGGHSCRRGGAQFLARMGVPYATIMWMGRWGSDTVLRYIREAEPDNEELAPDAVRALMVREQRRGRGSAGRRA